MGIKQLSKVIADNAPKAITEHQIKEYFGRKVAIDASMSIYQFLIAVRSEGQTLTNEAGDTTSHLMGLFYRTIRMIENGLKPVYVFDGAPPALKSAELKKRGVRRSDAQKGHEDATERGDADGVEKFAKRSVKVTPKHSEECMRLSGLMGVPFIQAPGEAEAQCAQLAKAGLVYGVGSEDMDTLTFATPVLLRHLTFSEARKMPIVEINLNRVLQDMGLTSDQFIDLCILLGCDYCGTVRGVGPSKAVQLIKQHCSIENILKEHPELVTEEDWAYAQARELFKHPNVLDKEIELKWTQPDQEALIKFMCDENGFNEKRIKGAVEKLGKLSNVGTQRRMDDFFKVLPVGPSANAGRDTKSSKDGKKRANGGLVGNEKKLKK